MVEEEKLFCNDRGQVLISEKENTTEVELVSSAEQSTLLQLQCVFQCGSKNQCKLDFFKCELLYAFSTECCVLVNYLYY